MSATLTIRKLDEEVKQKLRVRAARHQRSMEAEVREILRHAVEQPDGDQIADEAEADNKFDELIGLWKERGTTDSVMKVLRKDD